MLRLNNQGDFRILVIADVQVARPLRTDNQDKLIRLIDSCNPNLIVLLGDMLWGPGVYTKGKAKKIIDSIVFPIENAKVPFAFISGNHDRDSLVPIKKQVEMYRSSKLCLTPNIEERDCSNAYMLEIKNNGGKTVYQLIFLDCEATRLTLHGIQYAPVNEDQLRYTDKFINQKNRYPTIVFQHIPVLEIYKLIQTTNRPMIRGHGPYRGKYLELKNIAIGTMREAPCPYWDDVGQFKAWVQSRSVVAAVFGHDHKNSFTGDVEGIHLIQTSCAGFSCYGDEDLRGGRLLILNDGGQIQTRPISYQDLNIFR